jgi:hypothetical protein
MIAQISDRHAPTNKRGSGRIPQFIYPDVENRDRIINFAITGYTRTEIYKIDLSIQVRHGGRYFLGQIQRQADGWAVTYLQRNAVSDGVIHESVEAAAIAVHESYLAMKRAARLLELR